MAQSTERTQPEARPPREDVRRTTPFRLRATDAGTADEPNDGLTLDGYAAVFNRKTIIDSWEGRFWEQIAPGSMKRSFRETPPKIQFDHGHHPLIGSIPIAELKSVSEEVDQELAPEGGAHVIGRLFDNWLVTPVRDAIAAEAINGMSFRFSVMQEDWHDATGKKITDEQELRELLFRSWYEDLPEDELLLRTLKQLKVPELGPVVWPAYAETSVGVRSQVIDLGNLTDRKQRELLAKAVLMADAAEQSQTDDRQAATTQVGDHPSTVIDTQRTTEPASAGEHESTSPPRGQRPIDIWVRKARDVVLTLEQKGSST